MLKRDPEHYNYETFRTVHLIEDAERALERTGVAIGSIAPDCELPRADGGWVRLRELRGQPVLLRFGSLTSPATIGSLEPLRELYSEWGDRVHFIDVVVRQAHPGKKVPPYRSLEEKVLDAHRYKRNYHLPWTVCVDDVPGTVHQMYGGMSDPAYLIDADGRVVFYNMWAHVPTLDTAIGKLFAGSGRAGGGQGVDRVPHLMAALAGGWPAIRLGLLKSYTDLERAVPGAAFATLAGYLIQPFIAPIALRSKPLPGSSRAALAAGAAVTLGLWFSKRRKKIA
ncbi:MAG: peroxiredoxin family protein [Acidobacteriota bacterium]|nr:peroxiredoxin family protein [Acidobacteriota bacterium]